MSARNGTSPELSAAAASPRRVISYVELLGETLAEILSRGRRRCARRHGRLRRTPRAPVYEPHAGGARARLPPPDHQDGGVTVSARSPGAERRGGGHGHQSDASGYRRLRTQLAGTRPAEASLDGGTVRVRQAHRTLDVRRPGGRVWRLVTARTGPATRRRSGRTRQPSCGIRAEAAPGRTGNGCVSCAGEPRVRTPTPCA